MDKTAAWDQHADDEAAVRNTHTSLGRLSRSPEVMQQWIRELISAELIKSLLIVSVTAVQSEIKGETESLCMLIPVPPSGRVFDREIWLWLPESTHNSLQQTMPFP